MISPEPIIRVKVISSQSHKYWYNDYIGCEFDVYVEPITQWNGKHYRLPVNEWNTSYKALVERHGVGALLLQTQDTEIISDVTNDSSLHLLEEDES